MTDAEVQTIAELLKALEPGFLPYPIFEQIARLVALPIVEFIPLRWHENRVEVLLIKRSDEYPIFQGMLHTPGTVIRATDLHKPGEANWEAFRRIYEDELKGTEVSEPHYVGSLLHASKRGVEQAQLFWVEVLSEPQVGTFYDAEQLPDNLIDSQLAFIKQAVADFRQNRPAGAIRP